MTLRADVAFEIDVGRWFRHCAPERITCYGARRNRDGHGGMWRSAGRKIE